jgi:hypothetical protein
MKGRCGLLRIIILLPFLTRFWRGHSWKLPRRCRQGNFGALAHQVGSEPDNALGMSITDC